MEITKGELKLISRLLEMAGNEFGNHGCNDMDQALWDEIGFTPEDRATLINEMQLWNGDTEDPYPTKLIHMRDDMVMNFYAAKLKDGNLAGSPAPTPPLDVPSVEEIIKLLGNGWKGFKLGDMEDLMFVVGQIRLAIQKFYSLRRHIASPAPQYSRTYGDLPGSIRNMVESHEWDGKNISEQRDYALDMVDFLERELGNFRRNQALAASPAQPEKRDEKACEVCGETEMLTVMGRNQYACPKHRAVAPQSEKEGQ